MTGSLLVITGPPGAGKSTVARLVAKRFDPSVLVDGDGFFAFLDHGAIAPWLPESKDQNAVVTKAAAAAAGTYAAGGYTTVYDGVVGPWFVETFAANTGLAALHYAVLLPSVDVCLRRIDTRVGHGFSDEAAARKMHDEFARATIDQRHVFLDPPDDIEAVVDLILASLASSALLYRSPRGGGDDAD